MAEKTWLKKHGWKNMAEKTWLKRHYKITNMEVLFFLMRFTANKNSKLYYFLSLLYRNITRRWRTEFVFESVVRVSGKAQG